MLRTLRFRCLSFNRMMIIIFEVLKRTKRCDIFQLRHISKETQLYKKIPWPPTVGNFSLDCSIWNRFIFTCRVSFCF